MPAQYGSGSLFYRPAIFLAALGLPRPCFLKRIGGGRLRSNVEFLKVSSIRLASSIEERAFRLGSQSLPKKLRTQAVASSCRIAGF
jgi:hypothetical protein